MVSRKVVLGPPPHTPMTLMSMTMTKPCKVYKTELFF
ncbi:BET1P/SFT1P-like protein 14A [Prunus dulcis]|uniref:BET1P/SFT1P-like protein 14A n=1 Tax=Prunus dulcis TaxID=3755 RepID=A0A4Y1QKP1_PRUDU|nr:BET1P/SFT1P-like protein 14A [Prunus dulcis]